MTKEKGWIDGAEILKSPNFDERKDDVSLIVIHAISLPPAKYGSNHIDRFFLNELNPTEDPYFKEISDLKVSSHFLIGWNHKAEKMEILQCLDTGQVAYLSLIHI